jgi:hypothetical protein
MVFFLRAAAAAFLTFRFAADFCLLVAMPANWHLRPPLTRTDVMTDRARPPKPAERLRMSAIIRQRGERG